MLHIESLSRRKCEASGIVDQPAYPRSKIAKRWTEYFEDLGGVIPDLGNPQEEPETAIAGPEIRFVDFPLDLEYDDVEARQVERMRINGSLPYNVDGVVSMARGERVRFLPGSLSASLTGEIVLLAGNNYDEVLATTASGGALKLVDSPEALRFEARRLPRTRYAEDFASKLRVGLVRGVTAGWAAAGAETTTEVLPDGGTRIVVQKAMLCEVRLRTRSSYPGETIAARPRRRAETRILPVA